MSTRRSAGTTWAVPTSHAPTCAMTSRPPRIAIWSPCRVTPWTWGRRLTAWSRCASVAVSVDPGGPEPHGHLAAVSCDQLCRAALVQHPPVAHGHDPLAQRLRLVELVGHEDHRGAVLVQLGHCGPDVAPCGGIKSLGQFVQDHQARPVEEREHQEQPLTLTAAQPPERVTTVVREVELLQQVVGVPGARAGEQGHASETRNRSGNPEASAVGCRSVAASGRRPSAVRDPAPGSRPHPVGGVPAGTRRSWSSPHRWRRSSRGLRPRAHRGRGRRRPVARRSASSDRGPRRPDPEAAAWWVASFPHCIPAPPVDTSARSQNSLSPPRQSDCGGGLEI